MRRARKLTLVALSMVAIALAVMPVSAWYWPIFGFSDIGLGFPSASSSGEGDVISQSQSPIPPGTFQEFQPPGRAELIMPGYPYYGGGPHHGSINFGPFGYGNPGFAFPFGSGYVWASPTPSPSPLPTAEPENESGNETGDIYKQTLPVDFSFL